MGAQTTEEKLREAAAKWVFETNGHKWSNNNNEAGDNYGSFLAGANWVIDYLVSKKIEIENNPDFSPSKA